jgi:hypothetical protein
MEDEGGARKLRGGGYRGGHRRGGARRRRQGHSLVAGWREM